MPVSIPIAWKSRPEWLALHCAEGASQCFDCFQAAEETHLAAGTETYRYDISRDDPLLLLFLVSGIMYNPNAKRLMELYRLTPEDHAAILRFQGGVCAISKKPMRRYGTDHCHATGLIRGIIDWKINRGLAFFNDDPKLLRAAADYLEQPPATAALGAPRYGLLGRAKQGKKNKVYGPAIKLPKRRQ